MKRIPWQAALGWILLGCAPAWAQTKLGTIPVQAERAPGETAAIEDTPAFVTVIPVGKPSARVVSVADLLEQQAGIRVRSQGGPGSYSTVSIRGADAAQVAVFIDGVPLHRASMGALDLSQLPVEGIERIEVYRGVPPIELGSDVVGGAINLVTRKGALAQPGTVWRAAAGLGSFATRAALVGASHDSGHLHVDMSADYRGSTGDFLYYDNRGTLLNPGDDIFTRRQNNGFDQIAVDAALGSRGRNRWELGAHGFLKRQGVPGSIGHETEHASLRTGRILIDGALVRRGSVDTRLGAHFAFEDLTFTNLFDEPVGNFGPSRSDGQTIEGGIDGRVDIPLGAHQVVTALGELRIERYRLHDLLRPEPPQPAALRIRAAAGLADEVRLWRDRLTITPALRIDGVASDIAGTATSPTLVSTRSEAFLSPRLGVKLQAVRWLAFKGSVGRFVRLPSLIELFGDGAFILPRPSLRPEVAVGGDAGLAIALRRAWAELTLEAAYFGRLLDDYISLEPSARGMAARNIGQARVMGCELRLASHLSRYVTLTLGYTFLDTSNLTDEPGVEGKQLPLRARHQVDGRVELKLNPFALYYEVDYLDSVFRDPQNYNRLPARVLHGLGFALGPFDRLPLSLTIEVRNLADLRVVDLPLGGSAMRGRTAPYPLVDVFDYPLPGRAIYATLALRR